ncbi:YY1-associated protein 1-like [Carlito syrichta]|uniref:YY1-associated protein 1-like n=1 Tax=Carlito syrichta TaxID=1868482 RepID=A0A3Q0DKF6_CARSF|nr:YY1-associated protein 1-like [Carlito syrichta]
MALHHQFNPKFQTLFQPCNLMAAMQLIEDFNTHVSIDRSPHKTVKKTASEFPCLPKQVAWTLATSKVFMYPELLPLCSLKEKNPQYKILFTKAEDNLLALGLKHFEGTEVPNLLISQYLMICKTARQLTVRIKNLNMNRAPDNIIKFYKKTKQLPVLLKCCEEIQPHQWKPPVEREEHRLPFWLKASLPSIQDELRQIADGAREIGNVTGNTEINSDRGLEKDCSDLQSETQYPLLLPKSVVLKLKPVANYFSRKAWRQKRSSILKPLPIRPSPSLQPSFNPGKMPARSTQSEAPLSKMAVQIPHPIQPATVLQTVPGVPPLGVNGSDSFESPAALPALPSEATTSFLPTESQTLLSSTPVPKVILPSLGPSKFRKPCVKRRTSKRKRAKASPCMKLAPLIHSAPVIFTVPATTVKILSLSSGCNMIQPVSATVAQSPQTIPITTLLVNPTSFPCPLNQPLVASPISPLIVSGNSVNLPIPATPEDKAQVNVDMARKCGREKHGPKEEEESLDDFTQDEEDEMSSASEGSLLSVSELQAADSLVTQPTYSLEREEVLQRAFSWGFSPPSPCGNLDTKSSRHLYRSSSGHPPEPTPIQDTTNVPYCFLGFLPTSRSRSPPGGASHITPIFIQLKDPLSFPNKLQYPIDYEP